MDEYNITPQYYQSQTSKIPFYYITRYDNIDMMGIYARHIQAQEDLGQGQQILPCTVRESYDTNPSWATMQSNGQVKINRAGYYQVTINYHATGEATSYYFTIAIRAQQKGLKINIGEQTAESPWNAAATVEQTVSSMWYFDVGDLVWATSEIYPGGGNHPDELTNLTITPYQFYSKFWG